MNNDIEKSRIDIARKINSTFDLAADVNPEMAIVLIRTIDALGKVTGGNIENMILWLHSFNHDLKAVPADLIDSNETIKDVLAYLRTVLDSYS
jgi:hypothetical protein